MSTVLQRHFIGQGALDDQAILRLHQRLVDEDLGEPEAVLIVDGCDVPKQGAHSVRVARQWCGALDLTFQTKPQLALDMLKPIIQERRLRFSWVVIDAGFGDNPGFRDDLDGLGVRYLAEVACDTRVWRTRPETHVPPRQSASTF